MVVKENTEHEKRSGFECFYNKKRRCKISSDERYIKYRDIWSNLTKHTSYTPAPNEKGVPKG